jgi:POT family proton-dependent oligopeptide transporter
LGLGGFLSGKLATLTAVKTPIMQQVTLHKHYAFAFSQMFFILCVATLLCLMIFYMIKRLLKNREPAELS